MMLVLQSTSIKIQVELTPMFVRMQSVGDMVDRGLNKME